MPKKLELEKTVCIRMEAELEADLQALAAADERPLSQYLRKELKALVARRRAK